MFLKDLCKVLNTFIQFFLNQSFRKQIIFK